MALNRFLDDTQIIKKEEEQVEVVQEVAPVEVAPTEPVAEEQLSEVKTKPQKRKKKETQQKTEQVEELVVEQIEEPVEEQKTISVIPQRTSEEASSPVVNNKINDVILNNNKTEQYLDIVNEHKKKINIANENKTEQMLDEVYNKMPVYNFSRNKQTGGVNREVINPIEKVENIEKIQETTNKVVQKNYTNDSNSFLQELKKKCEQDIVKTNLEIEIHVEMYKTEANERQKNLINLKLTNFKEQLSYLQLRKNIIERML